MKALYKVTEYGEKLGLGEFLLLLYSFRPFIDQENGRDESNRIFTREYPNPVAPEAGVSQHDYR